MNEWMTKFIDKAIASYTYRQLIEPITIVRYLDRICCVLLDTRSILMIIPKSKYVHIQYCEEYM